MLYNLKPVIPEPMDPLQLSIAEVGKLLREHRITSLALTRLCLERIATLDAKLNAFITVTADSALSEAAEADRLIAEGRWLGPLHGVPVALKDLIDVAGVRTTAASRVLDDNAAATDASVVTRLRRRGAVILGKLNLHEFAYGGSGYISAYGPSLNPLDPTRTTGGSSSGSATAVAAHMCFAALGTDTAGSIRLPAACCSLVGFKPTWGAVSVEGVIPLSASYDHVGPIARSVEDAALVFEAIVEPDFVEEARTTNGARPVIGVARHYFCDDMTPEAQVSFDRTVEILECCCDIVEIEVPADAQKLRPLELKMLRNTRPFNVLGWPAVTLPSIALTDKLRLGLQFAARPGADRRLLQIARIVESCIARMGEPGSCQ